VVKFDACQAAVEPRLAFWAIQSIAALISVRLDVIAGRVSDLEFAVLP
jgi:hypothetical protein